jgi:hypothetical protein
MMARDSSLGRLWRPQGCIDYACWQFWQVLRFGTGSFLTGAKRPLVVVWHTTYNLTLLYKPGISRPQRVPTAAAQSSLKWSV